MPRLTPACSVRRRTERPAQPVTGSSSRPASSSNWSMYWEGRTMLLLYECVVMKQGGAATVWRQSAAYACTHRLPSFWPTRLHAHVVCAPVWHHGQPDADGGRGLADV